MKVDMPLIKKKNNQLDFIILSMALFLFLSIWASMKKKKKGKNFSHRQLKKEEY